MALFVQLTLIVLAVSLDGFTVGITYGLRKITITVITLSIIIICSGIVVFCSMSFGKLFSQFFPPIITSYIGGAILICLGVFLFISLLKTNVKKKRIRKHSYSEIIKDPTIVDQDQSGSISVKEAFVLGIALALDAFGAGFGAAMLGYPKFITTGLIAVASGIFVYSGFKLGHLIANIKWIENLTYFPPILLISIGCSSFI